MTEDTPPPRLSRRQFLTRGWAEAAGTASRPATPRPRHVRPPRAIAEPAFLAACDGCGACIRACPHGVVFALSATSGPGLSGTPALDLLNRGCRLCADLPCVAACPTGALDPVPAAAGHTEEDAADPAADAPPPGLPPVAPLAECRIDTASCIAHSGPECGACAPACPVPGALQWEGGTKPVIDAATCLGCALCREACVMDPKAITVRAPI